MSQKVENVHDLKIEDIEDEVENEFGANVSIDDMDRIDVISGVIETQEQETIEVKRQDSTPNMFYKVNNKTITFIGVHFQESTIETLTAILKIHLMSLVTLLMISSYSFGMLYMYLMTSHHCNHYDSNFKLILRFLNLFSTISYPFIVKRKLEYFHTS